jgi:hypothetical protein
MEIATATQNNNGGFMNGAHIGRQGFSKWTADDTIVVARKTLVLMAQEKMPLLAAARRAQTLVVPAERHRNLHQLRDLRGLEPVLQKLRREVEEATETPIGPLPLTPKKRIRRARRAGTANVWWTADERRTIAVESKRLLSGFADMTRVEAIRKAIEYALPSERRRNITSFQQVAWITDEWTAIEQEERTEREAREAREHDEAERQQAAREAAERAAIARRATEATRVEAPPAVPLDPASLPFDTLIEAIGTKVAGMLMRSIGEHLQESIMQRVNEALAHVQITVPAVMPAGVTRLHSAPRNRKPRVLVVGLLNQQEQDMTRAMGEFLDLEYAKSEHHKTLEDRAKHADLVVLMTKFISHKHQEIVRHVNEHIVYQNGGVSELKRWLTRWVNGEVATAAA